jgi:hypothetical protein
VILASLKALSYVGRNGSPRNQISQLAARQHGNVTRAQLLALGLGAQAIKYRVAHGGLHPVYRGVYAVGRPARLPLERAAAAVLACGPGAVLSHRSALSLWGLAKTWTFPLHVTIPAGDRRPKAIVVHRSPTLARQDVRPEQGIWATNPARTILDCAPDLEAKRLTRLVNDARHRGHLTPESLSDIAQRYPRHPGTTRLGALNLTPGGPTDSGFEDDFITFCHRHRLPTPTTNIHLLGFRVDAYFPDHGVIVELDSWKYHGDREAFITDRERDRITTAAGLQTVRLSDEALTAKEAAQLKAILANRIA